MNHLLDMACAQMGTVLSINRRDMAKRLSVGALISLAILYYADLAWAAAAYGFILLNEAAFFFLLSPPKNVNDVVDRRKTLTAIFVISFSLVPWVVPGLVLMAQAHQASQILGFVWVCAVMVHTLAFYTMTVLLGWSTIIMHSVMFTAGHAVLYRGPVAPISDADLAILLLYMTLWFWNTWEVMGANANNRRAFGEARFQAEERLKLLDRIANEDPLTNLMNRRAFDEALSDMLLMVTNDAPLAVVLFDLDGFKPVNDTYGHQAGDEVLIEIGKRLGNVPQLRCVARLGGDEFVAIVPGIAAQDMPQLINSVFDKIKAPVMVDDHDLCVGASAGFAMADRGSTVAQLIGQADAAMYQNKLMRKSQQQSVAAGQ